MRALIILAFGTLASAGTNAQQCPVENTSGLGEARESSALHGTLIFHDELRQWLGISLDRPICGQTEIQLVFSNGRAWREAEALRACAVTAIGKLYYSPTGYYSTATAVSDAIIRADPSCHPFPVKPDPSQASIPTKLMSFRARILVDFRGRGHTEVKIWSGGGRQVPMKPWQTYVNFNLTGLEDVIWFSCRRGFHIKSVVQTPKAKDGIFLDDPNIAGTVLQNLNGVNVLQFICERTKSGRRVTCRN